MGTIKNISFYFFFFVLGVSTFLGYSYYLKVNTNNALKPQNIPSVIRTSQFSLINPPSISIQGIVTSISGENVFWQGRIATEEAKITNPVTVSQGEMLETGEKSRISANFSNAATILLQENSSVDVVQTLPTNIVFSQKNGEIEYQKNADNPISVRVGHLLISISDKVVINNNLENKIITVEAGKNPIIIAYNDKRLISHVVEIPNNKKFIFNDGTRKGVIK